MTDVDTGSEGFADEDRLYAGSRFKDVADAVFANPYQQVWGRPGAPALPDEVVTIRAIFGGLLQRHANHRFERATERSVDSGADLRWGADGRGFRRFLHPNGICLTGHWEITEDTPYSGYFARGRRALVVARYSSGASGNKRGQIRSLAMVGKLFPTTDPNHAEPLRTANFITQEDIGGATTRSINEAVLRNAPDVTVFRRGPAGTILVKIASVFRRVDREPTVRQLYQVAELGKRPDEPTRAPAFMQLLLAPGQPVIPGDHLDYRDEIMAHIYDAGDPAPKRTLTFTINTTDEGTTRGTPFRVRRTFSNWRQIGTLTFDRAVASYNGDAVIHFTHPSWRLDRNDPSTATRVNGAKVR